MNETLSKNPSPNSVQLKLVVSTAAEAVDTIRERFGADAKVLSVKQAESGGISRLLQKPRLEVIVEVPSAALDKKDGRQVSDTDESASKIKAPEVDAPLNSKESHETPSDPLPEIEAEVPAASPKASTESPAKPKMGYFAAAMDDEEEAPKREVRKVAEAPLGSAANPVRQGTMENVRKVVAMLKSVGFEDSMIERIRYELDFRSMGNRSTIDMYGAICEWLRRQFPETKPRIAGQRRAFVGSCGAGKTSALCKSLSSDVFVNGLEPKVLKLDGDVPNPSEGLETFCEILGASFGRSWQDVGAHSEESPLYIDLPGIRFHNESSVESCREILDELAVDERVMVINAAYDTESIGEAMLCAERLGATAVVFTHLDEVRRAGKLWRFVLNRRIRPLFFSTGPNQAGDYALDPFSALLEKTFPHGSSLARGSAGVGQSETREEVAAL